MRNLLPLYLALVVSSCGAEAPAEESYDKSLVAAKEAIELSAKKGHAWTTADQLIEAAAKAMQDGDEAGALLLANEARIHAELAVVQADNEAATWRDRLISE
jgi:hypothetical protein